jgi:hypothetical protein
METLNSVPFVGRMAASRVRVSVPIGHIVLTVSFVSIKFA